jgi:hypothetical protein
MLTVLSVSQSDLDKERPDVGEKGGNEVPHLFVYHRSDIV